MVRAAALAVAAAPAAAHGPVGHVTFMRYPGYGGELRVKGSARVTDAARGGALHIAWDMLDVDPRCAAVPAGVPNACGVHVHEGATCADAGAVGGHYWDKAAVGDADPWAGKEFTADRAARSRGGFDVKVGYDAAQVMGRAVVVHDHTGGRAACGVLTPRPTVRRDYPDRNCTNADAPRFNPRRARMHREMGATFRKCIEERRCPLAKAAHSSAACAGGKVEFGGDSYDCSGIDLVSFVPVADLGSEGRWGDLGNDIWGWVDPETGREIAIHQLRNSQSFVDVTNAENPTVLAWMAGTRSPSGGLQPSWWRDAKVYRNHMFLGADDISNHGLQIFDLTRLRQYYDRKGVIVPEIQPDLTYSATGFGPSHNIAINEETGFLYSLGSLSYRGGPHIVDISDPKNPRFVAGFDGDGYTHDAEIVVYRGPDARYQGHEIFFAYNENTLTILDVSDKDDIKMLSRVPYRNNYYTHQGWLTEDHSHLLLDDELDEMNTNEKHTRTLQWNIVDLTDPQLIGTHISSEMSIDHNLYIKGDHAYMSQMCSGLRVLDVSRIAEATTPEVAFFDTAPYCDTQRPSGVEFSGTWSNYPYFPSGNIIVNNIETGLFVFRLQDRVKNNVTKR